MRKRIAVLGAAAGLLTAWGLGSTPAAAATYCGSACDGENPATYLVVAPGGPGNYYHCGDDAWTAETNTKEGHPAIELRYSTNCATAWARVPSSGGTYAIQVRSYYSNGTWRRTENKTIGPGGGYTLMVNDQNLLARACILIPYGSWDCTPYF